MDSAPHLFSQAVLLRRKWTRTSAQGLAGSCMLHQGVAAVSCPQVRVHAGLNVQMGRGPLYLLRQRVPALAPPPPQPVSTLHQICLTIGRNFSPFQALTIPVQLQESGHLVGRSVSSVANSAKGTVELQGKSHSWVCSPNFGEGTGTSAVQGYRGQLETIVF